MNKISLKTYNRQKTENFCQNEMLNYETRVFPNVDSEKRQKLAMILAEKEVQNDSDALNFKQYVAQDEEEQAILRTISFSTESAKLKNRLKSAYINANREYEVGNNEVEYLKALEEVFATLRAIAQENGACNPMEFYMNKFQKGVTIKETDEIFAEIEKQCLVILKSAKAQSICEIEVPDMVSDKLCQQLIDNMGMAYNFKSMPQTRLAFCNICGKKDVRLAINKNGFKRKYFGLMHELGHARYIFDTMDRLEQSGLWLPCSGALDEAIAIFYEKMIGYSDDYLHYLQKKLNSENVCVSFEAMKSNLGAVKPCITRAVSDDVCFSLHIIMRYEIEKKLLDGSLSVWDLKNVWNDYNLKYFGYTGKDYRENYAQDVHWTIGYIGYFPMYLFGKIYASMIYDKLFSDSSTHVKLSQGDLSNVREFVKENVTKFGSLLSVDEIMTKLTGKKICVESYIRYLNRTIK